ncbi:LysM peptidoglycan-binding domain-containing protein [Agromyces laixinhei]|uniref:LysM peptidoglycan-binding domain-containing protein n=1 Tax=Agromyces laixinhei TaxID=2585717 RepID=UPI0011167397|nr:LysM peptidoglycan-binding domain-containing protein [Agromyces laixinhei]
MSAVIATTGFQAARVLPRDRVRDESSRTRLRLTRRGRIVFTSLAALPIVIWAFVIVLGSGGAAADIDGAGAAVSFEYVTVGHGDSLWGIAETVDPNADVREVIDEIIRLNGLDGAMVEPGQRLALPIAP